LEVPSFDGSSITPLESADWPKFCASMWTKEESDEIRRIAKETVPDVKTMAIPHGLQVEKGPDAVVEFLKEQWPGLVDS